MSSGCLCCTIRGDLVSTLKDAHWRFSRGGERQFDRVVIETTGLADPAPIIQTLMTVGVITRRYRFDGVVTTVDLTNAERMLDTQPEALKQAAMADCLLLTKSDLAEPAASALEQTPAGDQPVGAPSARAQRRRPAGHAARARPVRSDDEDPGRRALAERGGILGGCGCAG
jgi:G3E family GTPase